MSSKAGEWVLCAVGALVLAAADFALHEATWGPNNVRIGEVVYVAGLIVLGLYVVVAVPLILWRERGSEPPERGDRWLR